MSEHDALARKARRTDAAGFSLIPSLVIVALVGSVMLPGPGLLTATSASATNVAARALLTELEHARRGALNEGNPWRVGPLPGLPHRFEIHDDDDGDGIVDPAEARRVADLGTEHRLATATFSGPIVFAADGRASAPGAITLGRGGAAAARITVNALGRIRLES